MDILDGLFRYLSGKTLLTNLIGSPPRLYPELAPQSSSIAQRPYIVCSLEDVERPTHLRGASAIADFFLSFDVWTETVSDRQSIGEAMRNLLHTRTNVVLTDSSGNTATMEYCNLDSDPNGMKSPPDGSEEPIFNKTMNFTCLIRELVPTLP